MKFTIRDHLMDFSVKDSSKKFIEIQGCQMQLVVASKNLFSNVSISNYETKSAEIPYKSIKSIKSMKYLESSESRNLSEEEFYNAKDSEIFEYGENRSMNELINEAKPNLIKTFDYLFVNKSHCG